MEGSRKSSREKGNREQGNREQGLEQDVSREAPAYPASSRQNDPSEDLRACPELVEGAGSLGTKNSADQSDGTMQPGAPQPVPARRDATRGEDPSEDLGAGSGATETEAGSTTGSPARPVLAHWGGAPPATSSPPAVLTFIQKEAETMRRYSPALQRRWWPDSNYVSWMDLGP
jgi:hypothetical protein